MKHTKITAAVIALAATAQLAHAADLNICVEGSYPPFSKTGSDGVVTGFDIDIMNALCDEMGKSCTQDNTEFDGLIPSLLARKCDAIIASLSITPARQEAIGFSDPYYKTTAAFLAKADTKLSMNRDVLLANNAVIGVQRGTNHHDYMDGEFPGVELRLYTTQDEAYLDLLAGRIDGVVADSVAMNDGFLKTEDGEGYAFIGDTFSDPKYHGEGVGIGLRKGEKMTEAWNAAIAAIRANGKYDEIQSKYFDFDIYGGKTGS